ncbi:MAG: ABC transporter ATP-binding protein, partial [Clostridiales bacterium]|nr:ABC transporter ATP-binding protein [Clostridiales bacterium]
VVICAVLSGVFNFLSRASIAKGSERFNKTARDTLFSHIQSLPFRWHTENRTGDIIQRCTSDVETTRNFVSEQLIEVVRTLVLVTAALVMLYSINLKISLVVTAFIPVILGYTLFFTGRISREFRKCDEAEGELITAVQENLTGVRVVRAFGRERYETDKFDGLNNGLAEKWIKLGYTLGAFWGVGDIVSALSLLAVIETGSWFAARGEISLGEFWVFIRLTQSVAWPVRSLGRTLSEMSKTGVSLSRLLDILAEPTEESPPDAKKPPLNGDIEFKNVSFNHGENEVLRGVNLLCPGGKTLGVLGATGSGKSTLTYLLTRLFELSEGCGSITVGGVDLRDIDIKYLRENISLVLQEPFLFSKTILENIDIAASTRDIKRVRESARIAAIDSDIMDFEKGYDTVVGERGVTLSGGQKQRVAIARTLMLGAPVMIFDDSMSSLDMQTDAKIRDALRSGTGGATVIIISHRISTLMTADTIAVIEDGCVAETGTHTELMRRGGIYKRIYDIQSAGGDYEKS